MQSPHIVRKTTDPVAAPPEAGIHWINTVTNKEFFSVGTASVTDWRTNTFNSLIDVNITSPQDGDVLTYDQTQWVNKPDKSIINALIFG